MNWTWIILVIFSCGAVQQANGHFGALEKLFGYFKKKKYLNHIVNTLLMA